MWKEAVAARYKLLCHILPWRTKKNHESDHSV